MSLGTNGTKWDESANSSRSWWDEKDESPIPDFDSSWIHERDFR